MVQVPILDPFQVQMAFFPVQTRFQNRQKWPLALILTPFLAPLFDTPLKHLIMIYYQYMLLSLRISNND